MLSDNISEKRSPLMDAFIVREGGHVLPKNCADSTFLIRRVGVLVAVASLWITNSVPALPQEHAPAPLLLDSMDGAQPVLRLVESTGVQLIRQAIEHSDDDRGGVEHVTLSIPPGASAELAYPLPPASVLPELRLEAWVWCNRPGLRLGAIVDLPRSIDESTGKPPRRLLIRSEAVAEGGAWQHLVLEETPKLLERQARVARASNGPEIDEVEAYVSKVVLLTPGGAGATDLWVDKFALFGAFRPGGATGSIAAATPQQPVDLVSAWSGAEPRSFRATTNTPRRAPPTMPRIIQWQGEPFEYLRQLGFDAVWMGRLPKPSELAEIQRLGLWVVCPPPTPQSLQASEIGEEFEGVLAWDLGELASAEDLTLADQWAQALHQHDHSARPIVVRPLTMPREASRIADIMVLGRPTHGATATWADHAAWLAHRRQQGRPGISIWLAIDTHRSLNSSAQLASLRGSPSSPGAASYQHLTRATMAGLGAAPRGFWFQSQASLAASDVETRMRALALELTNMRLGMAQPWLAGRATATAARSSQPDLTAMVLSVERSHLVVPMRWSDSGVGAEPNGDSLTPGKGMRLAHDPTNPITFLLPNVPESCEAYLLSIAGPRQLSTRRMTGGLSIAVGHLPDDAFVLLTDDGQAFSHVEAYLRRCAPRAAQARVELAALERQEAFSVARRLAPALAQLVDAQQTFASVDASMTAVERTLATADYSAAFARAASAEQILEGLKSKLFHAMWPQDSAGACPFRGDWATLPDVERVARVTAASRSPLAPFPAGEFEDLASLVESGWQRSDDAPPGVEGTVRLSPDAPHGGRYCLELAAQPTKAGEVPPLATPPVWITSPPLAAPEGQLVEITGWVRIAEPPIGSADPLLIFDSIGGEESAVRIESGPSWQPFRLVRAPAPGMECRLTIALGGVGRAAIDSIAYRFMPVPVGTTAR